jgi:hypothetical protein
MTILTDKLIGFKQIFQSVKNIFTRHLGLLSIVGSVADGKYVI